MDSRDHYRQDHLLAKSIVYILYLLVGTLSIELNNPYIALVLGTSIWLFGINCIAYLIEYCSGHQHQHTRI